MNIDKDIKWSKIKADMPLTLVVLLAIGLYFYLRYGWWGVLEVYLVGAVLINMTERQFQRMASLQQDRDRQI